MLSRITLLALAAWLVASCAAPTATAPQPTTAAPATRSSPTQAATATAEPLTQPSTVAAASTRPGETATPTEAAAAAVTPTEATPTETAAEEAGVKISLNIEGRTMTATLNASQAAQDFASLLPVTLTMEDYNGTEKIGYPPGKLSAQDAPPGIDPEVGDITYYAPWGNLAIFYRDFGYSTGLVLLGTIDGGVELLNMPGSVTVTIERAE